jgi:hypothetical protein
MRMTKAAATNPPAPLVAARPEATRPLPALDEIRDIVVAFERCELPLAAWTHRAHLVTALWYLVHYGTEEGGERVRTGIKRFNAANGVAQTPNGGYHETITCFYLRVIARHLRDAPPGASFADLASTLVTAWGDKNRPLEYYSRDRLSSWEARTGWVEPDLKVLE